ncbi:MAG TPA: tyrosine-protein phosphatase [Nocardioidaceae bacterium]|nr:tyrosine-protein phosphatase [Nocardioidaceae bacterium]
MTPAPPRVEVEAAEAGQLMVRWEPVGDHHVDIGYGPTPHATAHTHVMRVPAGERSVQLIDLPTAGRRPYVSLSRSGDVLIAAERRIPLDGVLNFRDLGGYPTASGRWTQWGLLFRSSSLHKLTADDLAVFDELGVRTIFDLRRDDERDRRPNPRPSRSLPVTGDVANMPDRSTLRDHDDAERWLADYYRTMVTESGPVFGELFTSLSAADHTPAVFHCAAGKDRTGLTAALLLTWLGVDRTTVLDDYELTGRYLTADAIPTVVDNFVATGLPRGAAEGILSSPRWAMTQALELIDTDHGGIEAYLRDSGGMTEQAMDDLRTRFVA